MLKKFLILLFAVLCVQSMVVLAGDGDGAVVGSGDPNKDLKTGSGTAPDAPPEDTGSDNEEGSAVEGTGTSSESSSGSSSSNGDLLVELPTAPASPEEAPMQQNAQQEVPPMNQMEMPPQEQGAPNMQAPPMPEMGDMNQMPPQMQQQPDMSEMPESMLETGAKNKAHAKGKAAGKNKFWGPWGLAHPAFAGAPWGHPAAYGAWGHPAFGAWGHPAAWAHPAFGGFGHPAFGAWGHPAFGAWGHPAFGAWGHPAFGGFGHPAFWGHPGFPFHPLGPYGGLYGHPFVGAYGFGGWLHPLFSHPMAALFNPEPHPYPYSMIPYHHLTYTPWSPLNGFAPNPMNKEATTTAAAAYKAQIDAANAHAAAVQAAYKQAAEAHQKAWKEAVEAHQKAWKDAADAHQKAWNEAAAAHKKAVESWTKAATGK